MASESTGPFPLPSEVGDVPGAENWRSMYPFFTRFQPGDDQKFWFYNSMHFPEPVPAFDGITSEIPYTAIGANTSRIFVFPTTLGIEHRIVNGRVYITANPVSDPEEIGRRLALFQERAGYYYENWDRLYEEWKVRVKGLIDDLEAVVVPELGEFEDLAVVTEGRGYASNHLVREGYHRCIDLFSKMWNHHTELLMLGYGAYVVFFEFLQKTFPEIPSQAVARMVAGIDVIMYKPDEELKRLAKIAVDLGVDGAFADADDVASVMAALERAGEAGEKWLDEYERASVPWFYVSTGDGFYHHHRSWKDNPAVPFSALGRYVAKVRDGEDLARPIGRLQVEREEVAARYRDLLESDDEKAAFDQMLGLCRLVFPYVEEHKFYCEHWFTTQFFAKIREFGALLERFGLLEESEDVFQLQHYEIDQALADAMLAWAAGGEPVGATYLKPLIAERKAMLEVLSTWSAPPALGPMPEALNDPAVKMLWGITAETITGWARASEMADDEVAGFAASGGVVEGRARVLENVNDIGQIQSGEILVCPVTAPSWGPVFGKIKAAVSDIGGIMSHAAIVAREYGMPAVVGTGSATKKIRTGDLVRVDGYEGVVTVLERAQAG
ncbi:MAG: PEP-utilizing enzyme [Acidimicrobiales bacterium]